MRWLITILVFLWIAFTFSGVASVETERIYLSGRGKDDAVPWRFLCTHGARSGIWTNIPVPSNWELHGFGTLSYKKDPTNALDECGIYERTFWIPEEWFGSRVFVVFEGVMTDTEVFVNERPAGPIHQGGFYPFRYEITKLVQFGRSNSLRVKVWKHSRNESVNRAERLADYWVFGGIYRPVYLERVPPQYIEHVAIDARHDGSLLMHVYTDGLTTADSDMYIAVGVKAVDGTLIGPAIKVPIGAENHAIVTGRFTNVVPWSAETPVLYYATVTLLHGNQELHTVTERFGFRTIEVREGDGIYLNGRRIVLKGVNRHSFWPDSGRCLSEQVHRLDIELIKGMNMNAVRCSHYPPDKEFLDLCDELGLYVLDELAGWHNAYDSEVGAKLIRAMVRRDVNHPCILFWNHGNEGGWNPAIEGEFAKHDPQNRRVLRPWKPHNGINTAHYLAYENAVLACNGLAIYYHEGDEKLDPKDQNQYIYMPTEFLHGMYDGGGGAGLEDYWNLMKASRCSAGGFIWAFLDEGVKRPDTGTIDTAGNQAPDGVVGPYREKEASYFVIKEVFSPVQLGFVPPDLLLITNEFDFLNASNCTFTWSVLKFPLPWETNSQAATVLVTGSLRCPDIPAGFSGQIKLPREVQRKDADALVVSVSDRHSKEIITRVWPLRDGNPAAEAVSLLTTQTVSGITLHVKEEKDAVVVKAKEAVYKWSKVTGFLESVKIGELEIPFRNGPRLAVGGSQLVSLKWSNGVLGFQLHARYEGALEEVEWTVYPSGWLRCVFSYQATGSLPYFGVLFDIPEDVVIGKRWVGRGPYRVWKNRLRGSNLGYWTNAYNDTITGMSLWIYPEFKGCFADVWWLQLITREGILTFVPEDVPFVQVLTPKQPPPDLAGFARADLPECGLGLLHAIPPIGSKFKRPETTGPAGQLNIGLGRYRGQCWMQFTPR